MSTSETKVIEHLQLRIESLEDQNSTLIASSHEISRTLDIKNQRLQTRVDVLSKEVEKLTNERNALAYELLSLRPKQNDV